jgi:hypothetical protein
VSDEERFFPEFGPLVDAPAPTEGPDRRIPFAHDHRVGPRLPHGHTVGEDLNVHASRYRLPPSVDDEAALEASFVAEKSDVESRPTGSSESLVWRETANDREATSLDGSTAIELVRVDVPEWATVCVERLATYIRATALDQSGQPTGATFVTGCCVDPFARLLHPTDQSPLVVRWSFLGVNSDDPSFDGPAHGVMGRDVQIEPHWSDLRFAWGSRYTTGLQLLVPAGITSVRLVASADSNGASWSLTLGGRVAAWWIGGGPRKRALAAATQRST